MNLRYLGDALDHWKGALLSYLISDGQLVNLAVYPMATDHSDWRGEDYEVYARLLRLPESAIVQEAVPLHNRSRSFPKAQSAGDVFLDPDTGISTGRVHDRAQYAMPHDVLGLLASGSNRVVAVYQHVRAQRTRDRVACIVRSIATPTFWASYESATVAMLFFSFADWRCEDVAESIRRLLARHAKGRVFVGSCT